MYSGTIYDFFIFLKIIYKLCSFLYLCYSSKFLSISHHCAALKGMQH